MDLTQIILSSAVLILTTILALVGIQVFLIFKELRRSIHKFNKIMDDAGLVSETVSRQVSSLSGIFDGVQTIIGLLRTFLKREERNGEDQKSDLFLEEKIQDDALPKAEENFMSSARRFFTRAGKRLS